MKIFATLEFFGLLVGIVSAVIDRENQTTTGYSDDGWSRHYTIPINIRRWTIRGLGLSAILVIGGIMWLIWSF